jgi:TonB family protein
MPCNQRTLPIARRDLEDLQGIAVFLQIGRELYATGVITRSVYEENGFIALRIHTAGFGPAREDADIFSDSDESVRLTETEPLKDMLFQRGPNYARDAHAIPDEPGVVKFDAPGVSPASCFYCPDPEYSDAARSAKFQGKVVLSVVLTAGGSATSIYVLKGAPLNIREQAGKAIENWRFRPAQRDGKPVPARVPIEITSVFFENISKSLTRVTSGRKLKPSRSFPISISQASAVNSRKSSLRSLFATH